MSQGKYKIKNIKQVLTRDVDPDNIKPLKHHDYDISLLNDDAEIVRYIKIQNVQEVNPGDIVWYIKNDSFAKLINVNDDNSLRIAPAPYYHVCCALNADIKDVLV